MSAQALGQVWDIRGVTPEEKLVLLWVANNTSECGTPVMVEPHGMGQFVGVSYGRAHAIACELAERGLLRFGDGEHACYIWLVNDLGRYDPPVDWTAETKGRSRRVAALLERDGPGCSYCDCTPVAYEVDHFVPRARGGPDIMANLVLACPPCNRSKRAKMPQDFLRDDPRRYEVLSSNLRLLHA